MSSGRGAVFKACAVASLISIEERFYSKNAWGHQARAEGVAINKHDQYVARLFERIKGEYDSIERHVVVRGRKSLKAEIDIIGRKGAHVDVYEVKCSPRVCKARRQLAHIRKLLKVEDISLIFYCGMADKLELVAG